MATKYTQKELEKMSRSDMAHYIVEITQTTICKDKSYCDLIMKIWLKKQAANAKEPAEKLLRVKSYCFFNKSKATNLAFFLQIIKKIS